MEFTNIYLSLPSILLLSFFVLIGNPIIVMVLMGLLGYTKRNSFLAGLTVAQISEFSLILIAVGVSLGHLSSETLSLVTAVGLITFAGSTYLIIYSHKIYPKISRFLSVFERKGKKVDEHRHHDHDDHDIILFGYNRIGLDVLESLKKIKKKFLIIDYDPEVITRLSNEGYDCRYGDANDSELLDELNLSGAKMIISTIPLIDTNLLIISRLKEVNENAIIVVVSHQIEEAERLYKDGATYVIMPHFLGGQKFSAMLERNRLSLDKFLEEKVAHLDHLSYRKSAEHIRPLHHHR
jgi:voltage-gated potassium channel Kch